VNIVNNWWSKTTVVRDCVSSTKQTFDQHCKVAMSGQKTISSPAIATPATTNPHRVLSCVLCQQRKVKCDRKFPCNNCVKTGARCVPATALGSRERRRRFPERELLDRLRHYEDLLRQNNVDFEPMHGSRPDRVPAIVGGSSDSPENISSGGQTSDTAESRTLKSETVYEPLCDLSIQSQVQYH